MRHAITLVTLLVASFVQADNNWHEKALVLDAHADVEIPGRESRYVGDDGKSQVSPEKMRAGGMDAVVLTIAVGPGPRNEEGYAEARLRAEEELQSVLDMTSDPVDDIVLVLTGEQLVAAHEQSQLAIILGLQNVRILGGDVDALKHYYSRGVRVFALTHMGHNDFADSSRPVYIAELGRHEPEEEHGGLSELGREAIQLINQMGGIIDVSQLSKAATLEVLALSTAPVIASHSNARAMTDVSRNLSDEELDKIAEGGGVVHVAPFRGYLYDSNDESLDLNIRAARVRAGVKEDYLYPFELYWEIEDPRAQRVFLDEISRLLGRGTVDMMVDHIDYIVNRVGIDHVGIGTDFNHGSGVEGFQNASEAMNVTRVLAERGYSQEDIAKIWGGNFLRVFKVVQEE